MLIGEFSKKSGWTKDTIRYYEKIGILNNRVVQRNPQNGYKHYKEEAMEVVQMLEIGKKHGYTLNEIKELLEIHHRENLGCLNIAPYLHKKLEQVNQKIQELEKQKQNLEAALDIVNTCLRTEN